MATILLAHGAGAGKDHPWMRRVSRVFETTGHQVVTFNFPYKDAGRSVPDSPKVLEAHFARVWKDVATRSGGAIFAAGKSMGGRIASMVAAAGGFDPPASGLIFFGYPLHPPGKPTQRRDAHLPSIQVPMLFLHGTRDPFGSPDEMRALAATLPQATLEIIDEGDHSLVTPKRADPAGDSVERAVRSAVDWIARSAQETPRRRDGTHQ